MPRRPTTDPIVQLHPPLTSVAWSTDFVAQSLEVLFIYLGSDGAHNLHPGSLAVGAFDVDDFIALSDRQVHRLVRQLVQLAHGLQRGFAHVQAGLDQVAQFKQAHTQSVSAGMRSIDKATRRQVIENAVRGRRVQAGALADELERQRLGLGGKDVEEGKAALEDLDGWGLRILFQHAVDCLLIDEFLHAEIRLRILRL